VAEPLPLVTPVVSDTSPLISLAAVGLLSLLRGLYREIVIPATVYDEYEAGRRPSEPPLQNLAWITISGLTSDLSIPAALDPGESAAIALAVQAKARALLLDERMGRRVAIEFGLPVVGTMGVLLRAKQAGLVSNVRPTVDEMIAQGIRIGPAVRSRVLHLAGEDT